MSIGLEGVAGREDEGTLGGNEGGTESGGLSAPVRDFTLDTGSLGVGARGTEGMGF